MLPGLALAFLVAAPVGTVASPREAEDVLTWGDQGDGTYRNPVLKADYSDPDVIRVGDDFYLVASDFHYMGMQVLHSRDLVNWEIVGQVFSRLDIHPRYEEMNGYAQGTWAPTLRHHDGRFYVYVCLPHDGLFMWQAEDPRGPWSEAVRVKAVDGWEDPAPFWDDDGKVYLIHSVLGAGPLILHRMSPDGRVLLDDGVEIYRGPVAEGPKLFKRRGYYYVSLPEGGVEKGGQTVLRSKALYGPYERRVVLPDGSPHQGGLVDLPNGESWFIGFKSAGRLGRVCHLLPVTWGEDDWPVFGDRGQAVERWKKPGGLRPQEPARPRAADEFDAPTLSPRWQWNHNPVAEAWSLTARPGWLRLEARPGSDLSRARNTLTQKLWDDAGVVDVRLDVGSMVNGQRAGLAFISGSTFGWVGVRMGGGVRRFQWEDGEGPEVTGEQVFLRGRYVGDVARLEFSLDGRTYADVGIAFPLRFGHWKGARVGVFCYGNRGHVDVDYVRYRYGDAASFAAEAPPARIPVILDTDIGDDIDDTWALVLALKSPELDVKLVLTDFGNTEQRARLAARVLELAGRSDIPIAIGIKENDDPGPQAEWVSGYDLSRYPGPVLKDGVQALIDTVMASKQPMTLIAIGPPPTLAAALAKEPRLAERLRFVGMYGSLRRGYGSKAPEPEWNVKTRIPAVRAVLAAPWREAAVTPLDTCGQVRLGGERYARIRRSGDPLLRGLVEAFGVWCHHREWCAKEPGYVAEKSSTLFDTVAVYLAVSRALVRTEALGVRVTDEGMTVPDLAAPPLSWAVEWKDLDGYEEWLTERMLGPVTPR